MRRKQADEAWSARISTAWKAERAEKSEAEWKGREALKLSEAGKRRKPGSQEALRLEAILQRRGMDMFALEHLWRNATVS